jgi:transposase-like protein
MFKRRRFPVEIVLICVRWYCKADYGGLKRVVKPWRGFQAMRTAASG